MHNSVYIFLRITLVTSLSTIVLPLISQNLVTFTPTTSEKSYITIALTVRLFRGPLSRLQIKIYPALGKIQLPISCLLVPNIQVRIIL